MNERTKDNDKEFGFKNEKLIKKKLSNFFGFKLKNTKHVYEKFDFYNRKENIYIELKSRRIEKNKYKTTLLNLNKITNIDNNINIIYFVFMFNNCLSYIKYNKEEFDLFNKIDTKVFRNNKYEIVKNIEIDINLLIDII